MDAGKADPEEELLNILSFLATSGEPPHGQQPSAVSWLSSQLTTTSTLAPFADDTNPWPRSLQKIATLLPSLAPRDLHAAAVQAIVFSQSSPKHVYLCLLLCAHALRTCPQITTTVILDRWKRWHSLLCETIALYQRYVVVIDEQDYEESVELWLDHVLPACQQVERALPLNVNRVPILAGMVSTELRLAVHALPQHVQQRLLHSAKSLVRQEEDVLWSHPWRIYTYANPDDWNDDASPVWNHQHPLWWWWTIHADCDDAVAGMDTKWSDSEGMALLAFLGYPERPLVYSPQHQWYLWFPHTSTLLNANKNNAINDDLVLDVLQSLLRQLAKQSLEWTTMLNQQEPSSPIGTLQLLMNRTMYSNNSNNKMQMVGCIKALVSRYTAESQVAIVSLLVDQCPHPGMIPRLLDLLRPIVTTKSVFDLLQTFVDKLLETHSNNNDNTSLQNVEELVDQVEVYVSVLSMIHLRLTLLPESSAMVDNTRLDRVPTFHAALMSALQAHDNAALHFRFYLLEDALRQVVSRLDKK